MPDAVCHWLGFEDFLLQQLAGMTDVNARARAATFAMADASKHGEVVGDGVLALAASLR